MKKYIALVFALVCVLSLVGCAGKSDGTTPVEHKNFEFEILENANQTDTEVDIFKEETETKGIDDTQILSRLNDRVIETVLENDESGGAVAASDVVMDQTIYGSFSEPGAKEVLVICKILTCLMLAGLIGELS